MVPEKTVSDSGCITGANVHQRAYRAPQRHDVELSSALRHRDETGLVPRPAP